MTADIVLSVKGTKAGSGDMRTMRNTQNKWDGTTDSKSQYFKHRQKGLSHDDAVAKIEGQTTSEEFYTDADLMNGSEYHHLKYVHEQIIKAMKYLEGMHEENVCQTREGKDLRAGLYDGLVKAMRTPTFMLNRRKGRVAEALSSKQQSIQEEIAGGQE